MGSKSICLFVRSCVRPYTVTLFFCQPYLINDSMEFNVLGLKWKGMKWRWRPSQYFFENRYRSIDFIDFLGVKPSASHTSLTTRWNLMFLGLNERVWSGDDARANIFFKNQYRSIDIDRFIDFLGVKLSASLNSLTTRWNLMFLGLNERVWSEDDARDNIFSKINIDRSILIDFSNN